MRQPVNQLDGYPWGDARRTCAHEYLLPEVEDILARTVATPEDERILDLGCGNGAVTAWLADHGFDVVGVDPSKEGIQQARTARPDLEFHQASAYNRLKDELGTFSIVVALEVVEHLYDPPRFARTAFEVLSVGGTLILSTPYHGWLKNVAIALLGEWDKHMQPLRVHGHIKFWSKNTLTKLIEQAGFSLREYRYAGRIPLLAKSMVAVARKPAAIDSEAKEDV